MPSPDDREPAEREPADRTATALRRTRRRRAAGGRASSTVGLVLLAACIVSTLWLTITGQLGLYIHPRYFVFTGIMAVIGLVATVAGFALRPADAAEEHDHDHGSAALGDRADGAAGPEY
ncbi:DUF1980 domain-containing protein, partial [Clavibacter michiganensis]|uniref:DUF1980 domain-containing protein n=1 Tax=Clavibacter michiganensis TaxID=28447 RepID=UPI001C203489